MPRVDVLRGPTGLVAVYKDGVLVCTGDKLMQPKDIDTAVQLHAQGADIHESHGLFKTFDSIPTELEQKSKPKKRKKDVENG